MVVNVKRYGMKFYQMYSQEYDRVERYNEKLCCTNPSNVHIVDEDTEAGTGILQEVRCRKCVNCKRMRELAWTYRGILESITHERTWWITLTWDPAKVMPDYDEVKKYLKRVRKNEAPVRYLCTEEHGENGTQRIHWHILLHCRDSMSWRKVTSKWRHGHVQAVLARTSGLGGYIAKYAAKSGRLRASRFYGEEPGQRHNDRWPTEDFEHYYRTGEKSDRLANLQFSHGKYGVKFPDLQRIAEMFTGDDREQLSCDTIPF